MARSITYRSTLLPLTLAAVLLAGGTSFAVAQTTTAPTAISGKLDGTLRQSHDAWRATRLDGAVVYNDQGNDVGTINDMLLDSAGKVSDVVLSVGGYLGIDSKYVEVPFSKLKFEPSKGNTATSGSADNHDYSVVLPGATKDSLKAMTAFSY
jgi:sporulation protein YlmC with PRC-barrel domain